MTQTQRMKRERQLWRGALRGQRRLARDRKRAERTGDMASLRRADCVASGAALAWLAFTASSRSV